MMSESYNLECHKTPKSDRKIFVVKCFVNYHIGISVQNVIKLSQKCHKMFCEFSPSCSEWWMVQTKEDGLTENGQMTLSSGVGQPCWS